MGYRIWMCRVVSLYATSIQLGPWFCYPDSLMWTFLIHQTITLHSQQVLPFCICYRVCRITLSDTSSNHHNSQPSNSSLLYVLSGLSYYFKWPNVQVHSSDGLNHAPEIFSHGRKMVSHLVLSNREVLWSISHPLRGAMAPPKFSKTTPWF